MDAIILGEEQAAALEAANGSSNRRLKARRLADGRLILNADVLGDPFFTDRTRGWSRVLMADEEVNAEEETPGTVEAGGTEIDRPKAPVVLATGIQRVTLSPQELV